MKSLFILTCGIAAILHSAGGFSLPVTTPAPSYGDGIDNTPLDPEDIYDFAAKDTNRIVGNVNKALARKAPYTDILRGGTIAAGVSTVQRSVTQEEAYDNDSLARPSFENDTDMCGEIGDPIEVGSKEFTFRLGTNRGRGPLVCIKQMRDSFEGDYTAAEDSIRKKVIQRVNSDIRATLVDRSGGKLVVRTGRTFSEMYAGNTNEVDVPFTTDVGEPNAAISFKLLSTLGIHMRENLLVDGFEGEQSEPLLKVIGSQEILEILREEAGIREDHRYLAAGSYQIGNKSLLKYRWEGPYRGFAFGVDPQPLRFSELDGDDGQPIFLEPLIKVNTFNGKASRMNPAWVRARFEVMILAGADSFARLTPETYNGEGSFKFPSQVSMGELKFKVIEDNSNNVWGDYGRHFFQISRAYKPIRPHAITAIAFKRVNTDFGLTAVGDYTDYSSSDSI